MKYNEEVYREKLASSLDGVCFDKLSGERFSFEKLFFPVKIDEGKYAFQSYVKQMELAHSLIQKPSNIVPLMDRIDELRKRMQFNNDLPVAKNVEEQEETEQIQPTELQEGASQLERKYARDNANKALGKRIMEKINSHQEIVNMSLQYDTGIEEDVDTFLYEPLYDHNSLIVPAANGSRILAVASAGHGKTTLLKRVALFYCKTRNISARIKNRKLEGEDYHQKLQKIYNLTGEFLPCIIQLREIVDKDYSLDRSIEKNISTVMNIGNEEEEILIDEIRNLIEQNRKKLLLLIDGLDELSDSMRVKFLNAMDAYLTLHPGTNVIMTTRVAGLSKSGVRELLTKMEFRGRSIIPLTDTQAKAYSDKWIEVTQPIEQQENLKDAVDQILNQNRFKYLKEFMRTPLELLVILKQVANDTLSLNRFQMFHDMLWELFTNHVKKYSQKQLVFDDTMTLLGFLAFKMQEKDSMFISHQELEELEEELGQLSFHTHILADGTVQGCIDYLDTLAANIGIVEKSDSSSELSYTFPIRSYQEYLTAYACCHVRLNIEETKPDPLKIVCEHFSDSRWMSIINFVLSDLGSNSQSEFETLLLEIFRQADGMELQKSVVEADLAITKELATELCKTHFCCRCLGTENRELLNVSMQTKSAYAYVYALKSLYLHNQEENQSDYLDVYALANVLWEYQNGNSACEVASAMVEGENKRENILGAVMLKHIAYMHLKEECYDYEMKAKRDLVLSSTVIRSLSENAIEKEDVHSVVALTNLWVTRAKGYERIRKVLLPDLGEVVKRQIARRKEGVIKLSVCEGSMKNQADYPEIKELFYALGTFPISPSTKEMINHKESEFIGTVLNRMYDESKGDPSMNEIAIATACLYTCWDLDRFTLVWGGDICKGTSSQYIHKKMCKPREKNHFELVRSQLVRFEERYEKMIQKEMNDFEGFMEKLN